MENTKIKRISAGVIFLRVLIPVVILATGFAGFVYLKKTRPVVPQKPKEEQVWVVDTETVQIADFQPTLKLYGEAISGRMVELRALVAGEIVETGAKLSNGSIVSKGETLLKIDPFKYRGALTDAKSRLDEAKARLEEIKANIADIESGLRYQKEQLILAETDLERATQLAEKGTGTKKLEDDRRVVVSQRRQIVDQQKSNLEIFRSKFAQQEAIIRRLVWGVTEAERNLKDTVLVSPFTAYVSSVNADMGRIVSANDRIATLFDNNRIDVQFTLSDSQYGRILSSGEPVTGRNVTINWRVAEPPLQYEAVIERVSSQISSDSGGIEVYARIKNPLAGSPIRPGTFVEVLVPDRTYRRVARLTQSVLFEGKYIYVVVNGRLERREVRAIPNNDNTILVMGNIKANEEVLATRLATVGEGVRVKSRNITREQNQKNTSQINDTRSTSLVQKTQASTKNSKSE